MLFGSHHQFAIEAMSEPNLVPPSAVWGRMRVWCQGKPLGDYSEECCALYSSYTGFRNLGVILPQLWSDDFDTLSDAELFDLLDFRLFGCHRGKDIDDDRSLDECRADAETYGMHNFLTNWGEQFDRAGKSFIFCTGGIVKVLNRGSGAEEGLLSLCVAATAVHQATSEFCAWFEHEQQRLLPGSEA